MVERFALRLNNMKPVGLIPHLFEYSSHGRVYFSGRHRHHYSLYGADLRFADSFIPGNAKVVFDSGVTTAGHGGCQTDNDCCSGVENGLVSNRVVEITIGFMLFRRKHRSLIPG